MSCYKEEGQAGSTPPSAHQGKFQVGRKTTRGPEESVGSPYNLSMGGHHCDSEARCMKGQIRMLLSGQWSYVLTNPMSIENAISRHGI